jgi:hypothetical protein
MPIRMPLPDLPVVTDSCRRSAPLHLITKRKVGPALGENASEGSTASTENIEPAMARLARELEIGAATNAGRHE